ncbi:MAG: A/G-specific adenine glycosylase [Pseudomonadota bacterium]
MQPSFVFVNSDSTPTLRERLLDWYFSIKREMPWRAEIDQTPNPYHVLVSEFMLQQTTVQTVIPFFKRFIERFPTIDILATAPLDDVYALWQGLGYYSRAKNLHRAAAQICALNSFPQDIETLKTLAGIGPYTSASISAIAFDQPTMPVDGNVMRVMSRLFTIAEPKGTKLQDQSQKAVHIFAGDTHNTHSAQALMELGALVCKPRNPLCETCPLARDCQAFQTQAVELYPILLAKVAKPKRIATTYVITNQHDQVLLIKRPDKGLFSNMFIFPTTCFDFDPVVLPDLTILEHYQKPIKHVFSHFDLELTIVRVKTTEALPGLWVAPIDLPKYGMPTLMHKVTKISKLV